MTVTNWSAVSQHEDAISEISPGNAQPKIRIRPKPLSLMATAEVQRATNGPRAPEDAATRSESTKGHAY